MKKEFVIRSKSQDEGWSDFEYFDNIDKAKKRLKYLIKKSETDPIFNMMFILDIKW